MIGPGLPPAGLPERRELDGLAALAGGYDGFLVDQWGVLHDGQVAYPGAQDCLQRLRDQGAVVLVVSNSGKRAAANVERMRRLGFPPALYTELITSGEVAWRMLSEPRHPDWWTLGHTCLVVGSDDDASLLAGLPIRRVRDPEEASFVLLASLGDRETIAQFMTLLNRALLRGLPLVCTNPDRIRLTRDGPAPAVGALAHEYEKMGGHVRYIGKPHPEVYDFARARFARHGVRRVLAIGDSLQHDVRGGQEAGFDTVFVRDGIYQDRFAGLDRAEQDDLLGELSRQYEAWPDAILPSLRW